MFRFLIIYDDFSLENCFNIPISLDIFDEFMDNFKTVC